MFTSFHKTDAEIEAQIREELRWDCRTETCTINLSVVDGVVLLKGTVKSFAVKTAVEEAAHRIAGVQGVSNAIEVKIPYIDFRSDIEITEIITQIFNWNVLIPKDRVRAILDNGWVNLVGVVDCWSHREEIFKTISTLAGVRGITNNIRVNAPQVEADKVRRAIASTLDRHSPNESKQVHVELENGTVRLSGEVPSWGERCVAVTAAGYAPGVRDVVDELKVVATA